MAELIFQVCSEFEQIPDHFCPEDPPYLLGKVFSNLL